MAIGICSTTIDWSGTGAMLQGTGAYVGVAALIWATLKGRQTFADYSAQKQSEKRIEAAEKVLTSAYDARVAIESVRSPLVEGQEIARAEKVIEANEDLSGIDAERLKRAARTQVFYTRLNGISDAITAVWDAMPIAMTYFGQEVHDALREIAHQRRVIQVAAEGIMDDDGKDADFTRSIRRDLYRGFGKIKEDDPDPIETKIVASIKLLEDRLLPILRAEPKSKRVKKEAP